MLLRLLLSLALLLPLAAAAQNEDAAPETSNPRVRMQTSLGEIVFELDEQRAPKTVANFLDYVDAGHYNGTVFHRVAAGALIQGGAYTPDLQYKPTRAPVPSESDNGLQNRRGAIAAARAPGDADSATAQFFINVVDNPDFDFSAPGDDYTRGYTVFGRVLHGLDVVDRIAAVETGARAPFAAYVPKSPVMIERVERIVTTEGEGAASDADVATPADDRTQS
ncbi:MAG TPA: peptidylprolyl isomerase [Arenimonas sp.]|nr:peptidylprolyl isomerase [Arenimonas sp.]